MGSNPGLARCIFLLLLEMYGTVYAVIRCTLKLRDLSLNTMYENALHADAERF